VITARGVPHSRPPDAPGCFRPMLWPLAPCSWLTAAAAAGEVGLCLPPRELKSLHCGVQATLSAIKEKFKTAFGV